MKTSRVSLLAGAVGCVACAVFGAQTSTWAIFSNKVSEDWMETGNWCNENGTPSGELPLTGAHNVNIPVGTTCSLADTQTGYYNFKVAGAESASGKTGAAVFTLGSGGTVGSSVSTVGQSAGMTGIVSVAANATWAAKAQVIGNAGVGIVTNAGKWLADGVMTLGSSASGFGRYAHMKGATVYNNGNFRPVIIGNAGRGELVVGEEADFNWPIYNFNGAVFLGCSQADNRIVVEADGIFRARRLYVGGRNVTCDGNPKTAGRGEIRLRGGSLSYDIDAQQEQTIWLGAFDGADGIDSASYGAIRGWGKVTGIGSRLKDYSGNYKLGYGEICADGEGDESRVLDCMLGMTTISNALPASVLTESGWRAVNRGIVYPRGSVQLGTTDLELPRTACVGCYPTLEKPDLVNSICVTGYGLIRTTNQRYFGMAVCAPDRTDAHTNALPAFVSVLGVIKAGVFDSRDKRTYDRRSQVSSAEVEIRYDQTKILRDDTRLELWHYAEKNGRWTRVARLEKGARPADCRIKSSAITTSKASGMSSDNLGLDELFNLGTFAVVEREDQGLMLILR